MLGFVLFLVHSRKLRRLQKILHWNPNRWFSSSSWLRGTGNVLCLGSSEGSSTIADLSFNASSFTAFTRNFNYKRLCLHQFFLLLLDVKVIPASLCSFYFYILSCALIKFSLSKFQPIIVRSTEINLFMSSLSKLFPRIFCYLKSCQLARIKTSLKILTVFMAVEVRLAILHRKVQHI